MVFHALFSNNCIYCGHLTAVRLKELQKIGTHELIRYQDFYQRVLIVKETSSRIVSSLNKNCATILLMIGLKNCEKNFSSIQSVFLSL